MDFSSSSSSSRDALEVVPSTSSDNRRGETMNCDLTVDLIIDIFTRLPVKSLLRFKSISKFWYSLIGSPNFISMHYAHSQTVTFSNPGIHTTATTLSFQHLEEVLKEEEEEDNKALNLSGVEMIGDIEIVGCFNGVVCLSLSPRPQKYVLWNPATRQIKQIGRAPMVGLDTTSAAVRYTSTIWYGSVFCFDPVVTNFFKVAQIKLTSFPGIVATTGHIRAQVNVFSTATNSWKRTFVVVSIQILGSGLVPAGEATYVNGYIHWLVGWTLQDMYILTYNMSDEVFQRTEMPSRLAGVHYRLTAYKGASLALFAHAPAGFSLYDEVDVWILNDCGDASQSWSKILTCKLSIKLTRVVGFFWKDGFDFILMYDDRDNSYYLHDPGTGETKMFLTRGPISQTFPYRESFVSL